MKHKYITKQTLLACRASRLKRGKDIHVQLEETIAERRKILVDWERLFLQEEPVAKEIVPAVKKDIHAQLAETIAEYKRIRKHSQGLFLQGQNHSFIMEEKKAA